MESWPRGPADYMPRVPDDITVTGVSSIPKALSFARSEDAVDVAVNAEIMGAFGECVF